jgi:hypothetical protein
MASRLPVEYSQRIAVSPPHAAKSNAKTKTHNFAVIRVLVPSKKAMSVTGWPAGQVEG